MNSVDFLFKQLLEKIDAIDLELVNLALQNALENIK